MLSRRKFLLLAATLFATALPVAIFSRMYFYEPAQLVVTHVRVPVKQWAGTRRRATFCAVGDLHLRREDSARALDIVSKMLAQKPDAFLLLGDYTHGHTRKDSMSPREIARNLAPLAAGGTPCFAVLGNHDAYGGREAFANEFAEVGIELFTEAGTQVFRLGNGTEILIGGTLDAPSFFGIFDKSCVPENPEPNVRPFVLLTHSPDIAPYLNETVDLTLCAHTHGGQICLPGGIPICTSTRTALGRKYVYGLTDVPAGGKIFTTRGTGTSMLPFRLFCLPEIVVVELVPAE